MRLTVEAFWRSDWRECGTIEILDAQLGYRGPSIVEYDIDYFANFAAADYSANGEVGDARAMSVRFPVDLESRYLATWPPFLLDLMPQGHARRKLAEHLGLRVDDRESDLPLLLRAAGSPVGNVRIKQAAEAERERLKNVTRTGVTEDDIFNRSEKFIEVVDRFGMIASGSSGLQGEWPKVALTQAVDGLYYPDAFVKDDEATRHVIVKLLRSSNERDRLILEAESGYSRVAKELGLRVHEVSAYEQGVLMIPRFDREIQGGLLCRFGQESMVSSIGVAQFGHNADHEDYVNVLKRHSDQPFIDIVEYAKRDLTNRAMGNPDNHGRNTALRKTPGGGITLAPLFDFAPMRLAIEGIARSTRWGVMRDTHRDSDPDWWQVCRAVFMEDERAAAALLEEMATFAERLANAPKISLAMGVPAEVVDFAMSGCAELVGKVLDAAASAPGV
ncbi:phosphatidylinositol kinase [Ensifer sp. Root31]|uniref:type II toxin-antitoxin system HipA family toxin n=1 Tax=Ensifer TaxID=106591 RepID=UPI000709FF5E|nr:HipA domain-containing protein [Ensifer sp. Root31]KQU93132.1 phosphatidylinositol kinase [Ensifer sp. Root31]